MMLDQRLSSCQLRLLRWTQELVFWAVSPIGQHDHYLVTATQSTEAQPMHILKSLQEYYHTVLHTIMVAYTGMHIY